MLAASLIKVPCINICLRGKYGDCKKRQASSIVGSADGCLINICIAAAMEIARKGKCRGSSRAQMEVLVIFALQRLWEFRGEVLAVGVMAWVRWEHRLSLINI